MVVSAILGFVFGFVGSVPIAGPIAALVLARGLEGRWKSGFFISLGAALAEAAYAFLAFYGFGELLANRPWVTPVSKAAGAVILLGIGMLFLFQKRRTDDRGEDLPPPRSRGYGSFALGASITAMNPTLIATWTAAVTFVYSTEWVDYTPAAALTFALGACVGIAGWFTVMLGLIHRFKGLVTGNTIWNVRRATGALVTVIGVWFAAQFVAYLTT